MKKRFCTKCRKRLDKAIKKVLSKNHCKCSRIEQRGKVLFELDVASKRKKVNREKCFFQFFKTFNFLAKFWKGIVGKVFGL